MTNANKETTMALKPNIVICVPLAWMILLFNVGCIEMRALQSNSKGGRSKVLREVSDAELCLRDASVWIGSRNYGFAGEETNKMAVALDTILAGKEPKHVLKRLT